MVSCGILYYLLCTRGPGPLIIWLTSCSRLRPVLKVTDRFKSITFTICTEWLQTDLKHLSVKSTQYTLKAQPLVHFALRQAFLQKKKLPKLGNPPNDLTLILHLNCQTYLVCNAYYQWGPIIRVFRSMTSRFGDTWLSRIGKAPNDLRMTWNT